MLAIGSPAVFAENESIAVWINTMRLFKHITIVLSLVMISGFGLSALLADESRQSESERLKNAQESVAGRFARFERVLSQMADIMGYDDPERAELLRRAISESREKNISETLNAIAEELGASEFGSAVEKQNVVTSDLQGLLKLLQSEDRKSAVERERERIANLLKDVNNLKAQQRAARAKTQNSKAPSNAAPDQNKTIKKTDDVLGQIEAHDGENSDSSRSNDGSESKPSSRGGESSKGEQQESAKGENSDGQSGEDSESKDKADANSGKGGEGDSKGDPKSKDPDSKDADPKDPADKPSGDSESSEAGKSGEDEQSGQKGGGQKSPSDAKSESQQSDQSQQSSGAQGNEQDQDEEPEQTPGRKQLEKAKKLMMEALDQLKEQSRNKAVQKQDAAISELQEAVNELEKLLQQLREEEKEMILATLEARFQRLLSLQTQVYDSTLDLAATPRDEWLDNAVGVCRDLGQKQVEITQECSFTTSLLREDGTSVSILVAVEDIESDMGTVAARLQKTKVGALTQSMETDVIDALKELIEATQREMAEMKNEQQQQPSQQSSDQKKPDLVNLMQEIKVLRSLQLRVNRRTQRVDDLFQEASPEDAADLRDQLVELANRQERLRESAAELAKRIEKQQ